MSELAPRCDISHSLIAEKELIFNSPFISDAIVWALRVCMKTCMSLCGLPLDDTRGPPSTMDPLCLCLQPRRTRSTSIPTPANCQRIKKPTTFRQESARRKQGQSQTSGCATRECLLNNLGQLRRGSTADCCCLVQCGSHTAMCPLLAFDPSIVYHTGMIQYCSTSLASSSRTAG